MKNIFQKLICLTVPFLVLGCSSVPSDSGADESKPDVSASEPMSSSNGGSKSSSDGSTSSTPAGHVHTWSTEWSYDETLHWHACTGKGCDAKKDVSAHTWGNYVEISPSALSGAARYAYSNPKVKKCRDCDAFDKNSLSGTNILPEVRFTFDKNDPNADFATKATKNDLSRPEVAGKIIITNCDSKFEIKDADAGMKVRGNQTAGWSKKGFRIKFGAKQSVLGLNGGKKFKKWILLADAKDTCLVRTALGLYVSKAVIKDGDNVWSSDFTPVTVYLNDEYWGFYYLCEQKEVKDGRVNLPEPATDYTGVDIGYCFELDHYADAAGSRDEASEIAKGADGDPTFRVKYSPKMEQGRPSGPLATGQVNTYTLLSDITDGPTDVHVQADYTNLNNGQLTNNSKKTSNSNQLTFIRDRVEALYQVLYEAAISKKAKEITEDNQVVDSTKTVQQVIEQHFDLNAWVDGYIINAYSCPPDLGYSSFYMSYDNSPTGNKKLRFDVPWDFDSNFGNRNNFITNADQLYVDNTYNTWIYLLSKLTFFTDMVKVKWNQLRDEQAFEGMFHMMREHFANNDAEIHRNHYKWPQNDAAHQPPNNFDEIRSPFKDPAQYKQAEEETISWCAKRVNYLEKQWGKNRADVNTNA